MAYETIPSDTAKIPKGIPYIISNEAAERFSFYGMKAALAIFLANYLDVLGGESLSETKATAYVSFFTSAVYLTPLLGAFLADFFWGKYKTIITLSIVYCIGHLCLAMMGMNGSVQLWLLAGLGMIAIGAGGIKPCVSAHVGDQFGKNNQHLLSQVFNLFYFSINFGAIISNLAIPWLLKWHGPHIAFGIPGALMALATLFFWMGRNKFIHIPAHGSRFTDELFSKAGLYIMGKLTLLFLFVAVFWCLFDQTATSLVFQAENMDLNLLGIEVLPSQIQAANPFLILILIPLFTWVIYPFVNKYIKLTPLRKIGSGLFLMVLAFAIIALAQESIDAGNKPSIHWQLIAYLILTTAEVLISIVCLEFAYTQAPKKMKSFVMSIFLVSVAAGNLLTSAINIYIQIPEVYLVENTPHLGYDKLAETEDDLLLKDGIIISTTQLSLEKSKSIITNYFKQNNSFPDNTTAQALIKNIKDPWDQNLNYTLLNSTQARLNSYGPDHTEKTRWDLGLIINAIEPTPEEADTWLNKEKQKLGIDISSTKAGDKVTLTSAYYAGGQTRLEGAPYFWFFTALMLLTAILFIPFSLFYKSKTYLQE